MRPIANRLYFLSPLLLQKIIWVPTRLILNYFGHFKITGMENLQTIKSPVIFACNHTSELDPFFVPASLSFFSRFSPIFYTSREKAFYENCGWRQIFYGGAFFKTWGAYPVHVGLRDFAKSLSNQIMIIRDGGNMCYFPEGRTTRDGNIQPAKGGVSFLAYKTGVPIVPVRIRGVFRFNLKNFLLRRLHLSITYGKPLYIVHNKHSSLSCGDFKMYANYVMSEVGKL